MLLLLWSFALAWYVQNPKQYSRGREPQVDWNPGTRWSEQSTGNIVSFGVKDKLVIRMPQ